MDADAVAPSIVMQATALVLNMDEGPLDIRKKWFQLLARVLRKHTK